MEDIVLTSREQKFKMRLMHFGYFTVDWQWVLNTFCSNTSELTAEEMKVLRQFPSNEDTLFGRICRRTDHALIEGHGSGETIDPRGVDWLIRWFVTGSKKSFEQTQLFMFQQARKKLATEIGERHLSHEERREREKEQSRERDQLNAQSGHIYVVKAPCQERGWIYKIGRTTNLHGRKNGYQTHTAERFEWHSTFEVRHVNDVERMLHRHFASKNIYGYSTMREWFALSAIDLATIPKLVESHLLLEQ